MSGRHVYAAVIGGGAAGMICAIKAAEQHPDKTIIVIEKADRVGKKLLVTGNGRCNLSHVGADATSYHGEGSDRLINILFKNYNFEAVLTYFHSMGLYTKTDSEGRVYPLCNQASAVLDVLRLRMRALGVEELCGCAVDSVRPYHGGYEIVTGDQKITADKVAVACGGKADYAGRESGSAALLRTLGVSVTKTTPALSPIKVQADRIRSLKGIRAAATVRLTKDSTTLCEERGEVQFTDGALSGICIFNLSRVANRTPGCTVEISLLPDLGQHEIRAELERRAAIHPNGTLAELFTGLFHKNIAAALIKSAGLSPAALCSEVDSTAFGRLAAVIDRWTFATETRRDFSHAQVTAGGVRLSEIDPFTFESRTLKGLYLIGEALDVDGDCGGYNLQFAFASGMCAGDHI